METIAPNKGAPLLKHDSFKKKEEVLHFFFNYINLIDEIVVTCIIFQESARNFHSYQFYPPQTEFGGGVVGITLVRPSVRLFVCLCNIRAQSISFTQRLLVT